jgi:hypothetical protein
MARTPGSEVVDPGAHLGASARSLTLAPRSRCRGHRQPSFRRPKCVPANWYCAPRVLRGGDGGWRCLPYGPHRALPRSSTRAPFPSGAQPYRPCWRSHAASHDPSTQIPDLPWPPCPPPSTRSSAAHHRWTSSDEPIQCNGSATGCAVTRCLRKTYKLDFERAKWHLPTASGQVSALEPNV